MNLSLVDRNRKINQLIKQNRIAVQNKGHGVFYFMVRTYFGRKIKLNYYQRTQQWKCECHYASLCDGYCIYTEACKEYLKQKLENKDGKKDINKN